jgi:hypothetical protein
VAPPPQGQRLPERGPQPVVNERPPTSQPVITGPRGDLLTPVFTDGDVIVRRDRHEEVLSIRNPPHVHQPLIQSIVDELRGRGRCESTGESGARASWVMDRLLESYRRG